MWARLTATIAPLGIFSEKMLRPEFLVSPVLDDKQKIVHSHYAPDFEGLNINMDTWQEEQ